MGTHPSLTFAFAILFSISSIAQEMNSEKLRKLIAQVSDTLISDGNSFRFIYRNRPLLSIYDEKADRMRIISPIVQRKDIGEKELLNALVANFHSALDVKYALSDEIIWSVFTHPLKELQAHQVLDAIEQVYTASVTFGTTYSSTHLVFPGNTQKKERPKAKKLLESG